MLLLNDNDFHPDESELHRFGADPRDQSYWHRAVLISKTFALAAEFAS